MPYNTRRKSLSLAELGILPKRSRAVSHPSPPNTILADGPPQKKVRTSHGSFDAAAPARGAMSPPRTTTIRIKEEKPRATAQLSPPPSPGREGNSKVDTEGINDDIVVGVIEQLQNTGNRPHLVKELAAVLATSIHAVDKSANPSALISSRLTSYLNRTRPAFTPCPLAKLIEPVHPRRLYFYLTTMPQQPLPSATDILPQLIRITPSLSSADDEEEEPYHRSRVELSPSPEVDLSSPELDDEDDEPASPARSFQTRSQERTQSPKDLSHNRRAVSPQLEPEEKTFKQTANQLYKQEQERQNSLREVDMDVVAGAINENESVARSIEAEENARDAVAELFEHAQHLHMPVSTMTFSSPMMLPQSHDTINAQLKSTRRDEVMEHMSLDVGPKDETMEIIAWDSLQSPENIELAELEDMFDAY
ncbi:hypothetical protein AMS68_000317 [Peltaster fructicola]|uniref:GDS1 winged helix domain-containing protein n=1 Tax=Peltaster fructicola TaxID=286661 RepID=A0A6H0XJV4_9PEZI|nr:hypothetical protein AMS68_000317 [Peltaster fructicola]